MNKFLAIACLAAVAVAKPEADAEADPALLYGAYGYAPYGGLGYGYAGHGLGYAGYGYAGLGYGLGLAGYASHSPSASTHIAGLAPAVVPVAKREAEADAEADPALLYGAYGYAGLGYAGHGYAGYPYAGLGYAGLGYAHTGYAGYPYAAGYASHSPSASTHIAGLAPAAVPAIAGGYAGAGRYIANS